MISIIDYGMGNLRSVQKAILIAYRKGVEKQVILSVVVNFAAEGNYPLYDYPPYEDVNVNAHSIMALALRDIAKRNLSLYLDKVPTTGPNGELVAALRAAHSLCAQTIESPIIHALSAWFFARVNADLYGIPHPKKGEDYYGIALAKGDGDLKTEMAVALVEISLMNRRTHVGDNVD